MLLTRRETPSCQAHRLLRLGSNRFCHLFNRNRMSMIRARRVLNAIRSSQSRTSLVRLRQSQMQLKCRQTSPRLVRHAQPLGSPLVGHLSPMNRIHMVLPKRATMVRLKVGHMATMVLPKRATMPMISAPRTLLQFGAFKLPPMIRMTVHLSMISAP
jgi:hypothetical protein